MSSFETNSTMNDTDEAADFAAFEALATFKYYVQGVLLTPISVFGMIGKNSCANNCIGNANKRPPGIFLTSIGFVVNMKQFPL